MNDAFLTWTAFAAPARWATRGRAEAHALGSVARLLRRPELWPGEATTLAAAEDQLPAYAAVRFEDDSRVLLADEARAERETIARVLEVFGLFVDYEDEPAVDRANLEAWWAGYRLAAWTTAWHNRPKADRPPLPRWRIYLPFAKPVSLAEAVRVAVWARHPRHDVGLIAASTEAIWQLRAAPVIAPGGFQGFYQEGACLDAQAVVGELEAWELADRRERARKVLEGTSVEDGVALLGQRQNELKAAESEAWPWPLRAVPFPEPWSVVDAGLGGLWPGRLAMLLGASGQGRSSLALQLAHTAAFAGRPVLFVTTRLGADETVARLLAQLAVGEPPVSRSAHALLLEGAPLPVAPATALRALPSNLHIWAPTHAERTAEALLRRLQAVSEDHGDRAPLLVLDALESWGEPEAEGELAAALADGVRAGTLHPHWPGAAAMIVGLPHPDDDAAFGAGPGLADPLRGALHLDRHGPVAREASLILGLSCARQLAGAWPCALAVLRDRHGGHRAWQIAFEPGFGRFRLEAGAHSAGR